MKVKPFRLKVRVQNNRLVRAREELGLTQIGAAKAIGINASQLSAYESLQHTETQEKKGFGSPYNAKTGEWKETARRISEYYGLSPEYLWPDEIRAVKKNALTVEMSSREIAQLTGPPAPDEFVALRKMGEQSVRLLDSLTPNERDLLKLRFSSEGEEMTLRELGNNIEGFYGKGVSCERARQIVESGIAKLKGLSRGVRLFHIYDGKRLLCGRSHKFSYGDSPRALHSLRAVLPEKTASLSAKIFVPAEWVPGDAYCAPCAAVLSRLARESGYEVVEERV